ncbi:SH3 domain-containing YSC84-like protein 1 [Carassius auratus]|uniref:SH3 domain-containing YSC84-like protein 1 n=1 Tax=Carassius auratus TaxID=7957 RepID=A0A6P6R810_CARAU|nr:SH3 domain-containing YSC84-like protein 1 [Carassius auratus]
MGPGKLIPAHVIAKPHGLAVLSLFNAGFMITVRDGSGIVIARHTDGTIDIAGLGGGFKLGLEMSSAPARPRPPTQRAASSYIPKTQASAAVKPALYPNLDNRDTEDQASGGALVVASSLEI